MPGGLWMAEHAAQASSGSEILRAVATVTPCGTVVRLQSLTSLASGADHASTHIQTLVKVEDVDERDQTE
jgi:hypothetical protein